MYTTSDRRNAMGVGLVFEADLATKEHISHWILSTRCLSSIKHWLKLCRIFTSLSVSALFMNNCATIYIATYIICTL